MKISELTPNNIDDLRRLEQNGVLNSTHDTSAMLTLEYVVGEILTAVDAQTGYVRPAPPPTPVFTGNDTLH